MRTSFKPKIKNKKPWFWFIVQAFWGNVEWKDIAFTFGDTIYSPRPLGESMLAHEMVHVKQQKGSKLYGIFCLTKYRFSKSYRLRCEIEAYRAQAKFLDKPDRASLAMHLSGPIYGRMISYKKAMDLLCGS